MSLFSWIFRKKITKLQSEAALVAGNKVMRDISRQHRAFASTGGEKFPSGIMSSGSGISINHSIVLQNARRATFDSVQAKALVDRFAESVADIGLKREFLPEYEILGITPEQAEEWGRNVSQRFHLYAGSKTCHRSQLMNLYQAQLLYAKFQQRDNDIFSRFYYSQNRKLMNPLQFEFVDPIQVNGCAYSSTYWTYSQGDGIERNPDGTEKSYRIWQYNQKDNKFENITIPARGPKSGKILMTHGFQPDYASQGRGYSRLAHAVQTFQDITSLEASKIRQVINQSQFVFGIENQQKDPSSAGLENLLTQRGAGPYAEQSTQAAQSAVVDTGTEFTYQEIPELTLASPGSAGIIGLSQGDTLRLYNAGVGAESFESFLNTFVTHLSASVGMPVEMLLMKFNQNYSASRATLVIFWRICQIWRNEMIVDWLDPYVEMWLDGEIASGRIQARGWFDLILRAAWMAGNWIGAPMPNIDPGKEAKAAKEYLEISATTQNIIARNLNGTSAKDNIAINSRMFPETPTPPWSSQSDNQDGMANDSAENEEMK